jgi:AraC-like DNA-binding protein
MPTITSPAMTDSKNVQSSVFVELNQAYLPSLMDFMVSHQVPFHLNYHKIDTQSSYKTLNSIENSHNSDDTPAPEKKLSKSEKQLFLFNQIKKKYLDCKQITKVSLKEIAAEYGISVPTINQLFNKIEGRPFYQIYMERKMDYAAKLLREGRTAQDTSTLIGYSHPIKFNKMFQKYFGLTPKKYQSIMKISAIRNK